MRLMRFILIAFGAVMALTSGLLTVYHPAGSLPALSPGVLHLLLHPAYYGLYSLNLITGIFILLISYQLIDKAIF